MMIDRELEYYNKDDWHFSGLPVARPWYTIRDGIDRQSQARQQITLTDGTIKVRLVVIFHGEEDNFRNNGVFWWTRRVKMINSLFFLSNGSK